MKKPRGVSDRYRYRVVVVFLLFALVFVLLAFRMAWIQIVKADAYREKAVNQQTSDIPIEAKRGTIYDSDGKVLATSATCYSVWVRPAEIRKNYKDARISELSKKLAVILNMSASEVEKDMKADKALVQVARYLEKSQRDKVANLHITGLEVSKGTKRYYPMGDMASKLLGSVSDDNVGRTGVEAQFDQYLSGVSGRVVKETDLNGNGLANGDKEYFSAKDGYNVTLTINSVLQHYAEEAVKAGLKKTQAKKIMCIVMEPKTGDILAMVTRPTFDPNDATQPETEAERKQFEKLSAEKQSAYLSEMWKNPIVSDLYEPGSTFKLLTASSALEEGIVTPTTRFYCPGYVNVDGTVLHCWQTGGHGAESMKEAVGNSCNPAHVEMALKLGKKRYYNYLEMFGITDMTHVALPAETSAIIKSQKGLTNVDLATMGYGQGIAVTPMQLITAVSAVGNGGNLMQPRIVKSLTDSKGKVVKRFPTKRVRQVISEKTSAEMRDIMEFEVSKGSGGNAKIAGYKIGGKTGTANKAANGGYSSNTWSSFIGMAPMDNPKLTVLVVVDTPQGQKYGNMVAAPVARQFLKRALPYLEVEPSYSSSEKSSLSDGLAQVPNVTGMKSSAAMQAIQKAGLNCEISPKTESTKEFRVKDQYPKAGKVVNKKSTVVIYRK